MSYSLSSPYLDGRWTVRPGTQWPWLFHGKSEDFPHGFSPGIFTSWEWFLDGNWTQWMVIQVSINEYKLYRCFNDALNIIQAIFMGNFMNFIFLLPPLVVIFDGDNNITVMSSKTIVCILAISKWPNFSAARGFWMFLEGSWPFTVLPRLAGFQVVFGEWAMSDSWWVQQLDSWRAVPFYYDFPTFGCGHQQPATINKNCLGSSSNFWKWW